MLTKRSGVFAFLGASALLGTSGAYALFESSSDIEACVDQASGALRIVSDAGLCEANEYALIWQEKGASLSLDQLRGIPCQHANYGIGRTQLGVPSSASSFEVKTQCIPDGAAVVRTNGDYRSTHPSLFLKNAGAGEATLRHFKILNAYKYPMEEITGSEWRLETDCTSLPGGSWQTCQVSIVDVLSESYWDLREVWYQAQVPSVNIYESSFLGEVDLGKVTNLSGVSNQRVQQMLENFETNFSWGAYWSLTEFFSQISWDYSPGGTEPVNPSTWPPVTGYTLPENIFGELFRSPVNPDGSIRSSRYASLFSYSYDKCTTAIEDFQGNGYWGPVMTCDFRMDLEALSDTSGKSVAEIQQILEDTIARNQDPNYVKTFENKRAPLVVGFEVYDAVRDLTYQRQISPNGNVDYYIP